MRSRWKKIRYRLEWLGLLLATKLIPLLSRQACLHLARVLGALTSMFDRHRYSVALNNLEVAFGNRLSIQDRRKIARESFQHFTRTTLDLLWSTRLTRENFSRYIEMENFDEITRGTGPERSLVRLYKVLRRKGTTALLVDLTVPPSQGAVAIDCFGLKTSVTSAHAWLHERSGAPIIPAHCEPLPGGRYRVVFHPKIDNTPGMTHQQIAQACWNSFEPYVRKNPAPWLWMYKHWRYRPANPDLPYPFYANFLRPFEDILQRDQAQGP